MDLLELMAKYGISCCCWKKGSVVSLRFLWHLEPHRHQESINVFHSNEMSTEEQESLLDDGQTLSLLSQTGVITSWQTESSRLNGFWIPRVSAEYQPLIGREGSRDQNTGLWLVESEPRQATDSPCSADFVIVFLLLFVHPSVCVLGSIRLG